MSPLRRPLQCTLLLCTGVVVKLVEGQVEETNQQPIKSCSLSGDGLRKLSLKAVGACSTSGDCY